MPNTEGVRVTIFNQTYSLVASEEPGRIELLAQKVDDLMSKIAAHGANVDATRAAVLACLHMADELDIARAAANGSEAKSRTQGPRVQPSAGRSHRPGCTQPPVPSPQSPLLKDSLLFLQVPKRSHVRYREGNLVLRVVASADIEAPVLQADATAIGVVGHFRQRV